MVSDMDWPEASGCMRCWKTQTASAMVACQLRTQPRLSGRGSCMTSSQRPQHDAAVVQCVLQRLMGTAEAATSCDAGQLGTEQGLYLSAEAQSGKAMVTGLLSQPRLDSGLHRVKAHCTQATVSHLFPWCKATRLW